eukprot:TRINITY_DN4511_c0_g1_i3.p1 TRINITY_DN4511_c0_g1~~TRINITY_DN4511_c0_g1_i3.p1  ORF type:complete len:799 (+),score=122.34 TRINITY_DN4511_c0_g1_i3:278-2674(+)
MEAINRLKNFIVTPCMEEEETYAVRSRKLVVIAFAVIVGNALTLGIPASIVGAVYDPTFGVYFCGAALVQVLFTASFVPYIYLRLTNKLPDWVVDLQVWSCVPTTLGFCLFSHQGSISIVCTTTIFVGIVMRVRMWPLLLLYGVCINVIHALINDYGDELPALHETFYHTQILPVKLMYLLAVNISPLLLFGLGLWAIMKEFVQRSEQADAAIAMNLAVAAKLRRYDTDGIAEILAANKGKVDENLLEAFTAIQHNLQEYRPHIPDYVIAATITTDDGGEVDEDDEGTLDDIVSSLASSSRQQMSSMMLANGNTAIGALLQSGNGGGHYAAHQGDDDANSEGDFSLSSRSAVRYDPMMSSGITSPTGNLQSPRLRTFDQTNGMDSFVSNGGNNPHSTNSGEGSVVFTSGDNSVNVANGGTVLSSPVAVQRRRGGKEGGIPMQSPLGTSLTIRRPQHQHDPHSGWKQQETSTRVKPQRSPNHSQSSRDGVVVTNGRHNHSSSHNITNHAHRQHFHGRSTTVFIRFVSPQLNSDGSGNGFVSKAASPIAMTVLSKCIEYGSKLAKANGGALQYMQGCGLMVSFNAASRVNAHESKACAFALGLKAETDALPKSTLTMHATIVTTPVMSFFAGNGGQLMLTVLGGYMPIHTALHHYLSQTVGDDVSCILISKTTLPSVEVHYEARMLGVVGMSPSQHAGRIERVFSVAADVIQLVSPRKATESDEWMYELENQTSTHGFTKMIVDTAASGDLQAAMRIVTEHEAAIHNDTLLSRCLHDRIESCIEDSTAFPLHTTPPTKMW